MKIPDDADGDAMRRVIADGADLTRPMLIDFQIDCPDARSAEAIAARISPEQFAISIYQDPEDGSVTCECSREMLLVHSELIRMQRELTDIARPFGGWCEAWGTFGNTQNAEPDAAPNSRPPQQLPASPDVQTPDPQRASSSGGCG
jgi:hypothetical protein